MKKVIFTLIILTGLAGTAMAQDCEAIVGPFLYLRGIEPSDYPEGKFEYRCTFSRNTFFLTDQVPQGSTIRDISELTDKMTDRNLAENFVVDLNTISLYRYDFERFQKGKDAERTIYFRLKGSNTHRYLGVRCYNDAMRRTSNPEEFVK